MPRRGSDRFLAAALILLAVLLAASVLVVASTQGRADKEPLRNPYAPFTVELQVRDL